MKRKIVLDDTLEDERITARRIRQKRLRGVDVAVEFHPLVYEDGKYFRSKDWGQRPDEGVFLSEEAMDRLCAWWAARPRFYRLEPDGEPGGAFAGPGPRPRRPVKKGGT